MNKLLIYCEASGEIGTGHHSRCRLIAKTFEENGWSVTLVCHSPSDNKNFLKSEPTDIKLESKHRSGKQWYALTYDIVMIDHVNSHNINAKLVEDKFYYFQSLAKRLILLDGTGPFQFEDSLKLRPHDAVLAPYYARASKKAKPYAQLKTFAFNLVNPKFFQKK